MKFKKGTRRSPIEYEKDLVGYWKKNKIFERSISERPADNPFVFYDGPPFITGVPHHGTLLTSMVKDAVPRYWTMKGKRVERVWGWDCHGLPAEVFTEKKLGISDKRDIGTKVSLEEYIVACRNNMVATGNLWEDTIDRIGRWVDFKGSYKTMDKDYMESVWWAFKTLYEKGKIYEGEKVLLYCTRDATPISKAEVAMDNSYQDVTDPSVYVKFKLKDRNIFLLAWTTTPWTLPSNAAIAVNKDLSYIEVEVAGEHLIMAEELVQKVLTDEKHELISYNVVKKYKGSELVGLSYEPLFDTYADEVKNGAFKVYHAGFVHADDGTGIAHESPAYGEDDYSLSKAEKFPFFLNTDENGYYTTGEWQGKLVWDVNKEIAKTLKERGIVWKIEYITHPYPHCHRCGTKLMYRAHPSWFMDIDGQRAEMLEQNGNITWFPEHIKHGRFADTVQSAPDWNLSRDRFWATAMPVWKATDKEGKEYIKVIGSYAELKDLSGQELEDYHRPWVDDVTFTIDGLKYSRIDKVLDCWFESGSMPFAQFHYPFENVVKFETSFPGDFIVEYVPQVRAWFYYLHAISVGIFGVAAFKTSLVHGTIAGNDGRKMSKSFGNYTDPNELMDKYSADALRFLFLSSPLLNGEDYALIDKDVADVSRKLTMIWNMYDFFTLYAEVDGWEWDPKAASRHDDSIGCSNILDQWIISRVHEVGVEVDKQMQAYNIPYALKPILPLIDDASNWYVRRSRKRFWKSEDDQDKKEAYETLHYLLLRLSLILAPFTPFLAEELYQKLTGGESVHLQVWPVGGHVNELAVQSMDFVKKVVNDGLSQRSRSGIKVRQPLESMAIAGNNSFIKTRPPGYDAIIQDELNVHATKWDYVSSGDKEFEVKIDFSLTPTLLREGMAREVIRAVQNARKVADLDIDDRIELGLEAEDKELVKAIKEHSTLIKHETLAVTIQSKVRDGFEQTVEVDGKEVQVSLVKHRA